MADADRETIAAAGAGRMGRGIAVVFAYAGHRVTLVDLKARDGADAERVRDDALGEIRQTLTMLAGIGMMGEEAIEPILSRVAFATADQAPAALARADVIFEGVPETIEAKQDAFALLSAHARADAIIASTTSTMLSDELQGFVTPPERFLNAHWLNPAFLVPLVEISPGAKTDRDVTQRLVDLLEGIGKVPVVCKASPGFIVPRLQALCMNEAARLVEEGVASAEEIDKATRFGFGFRFAVLGVLEFIDWGGGDILYHADRYMTQALGTDRYVAPKIVEDNMQAGRIGLKTREGFLDYSGMDVGAYQRDRLAAFVGLLRHMGAARPPIL
ncbi:3-hydroxybutyryl-CoA dehydrogenase [Microbaculum sp. FT89]|uniref:3-hydroxybutyryl-CoA dehydrogenase n=1 Tax=Microbaculum sp. FT89 TaxID=3447298 RepID=UPI003F52BB93